MQVDFFLPYLKNRYGFPYGVRWGYKGPIFKLDNDEADIWTIILFIGDLFGDPFDGSLKAVGPVRICTVKDKTGEGCIFLLEHRFGHNSPTGVSAVRMTEVVPYAS